MALVRTGSWGSGAGSQLRGLRFEFGAVAFHAGVLPIQRSVISFGIDPGSQRTGWAAVEANGNRLRSVGHGVIRLDGTLPDRLGALLQALDAQLEALKPERVVLESVFHHKNARSALVLGHARGVALVAAHRWCPHVGELSPSEVKKAVTGSGRADKTQMQHMVKALLGLAETPAQDAADALAIAVAGAVRHSFEAVLARAP